jgi:hypothetical protein
MSIICITCHVLIYKLEYDENPLHCPYCQSFQYDIKQFSEWQKKQYEYIDKLLEEDLGSYLVRRLWTYEFHECINARIRGHFDMTLVPYTKEIMEDIKDYCASVKYEGLDLYNKQSVEKFLNHVIDHLQQVIMNAPKLPIAMKVYKGFNGVLYKDKGFISTTINKEIIQEFAKGKFVLKGIIPAYSHCLWFAFEDEILLPDGTNIETLYVDDEEENVKETYHVIFHTIQQVASPVGPVFP